MADSFGTSVQQVLASHDTVSIFDWLAEPLHIFDPRRNFQLQGFTGRAATTTLHDATETGVSISGIFQAAEDFAVLGLWNAYDYFNHLRLKHLPKTDLSGLKLEFDIEYDQALDGAMRLDAAKYPSVSWDAMTFEFSGAANTYEVRLLDHATVVCGSETAASGPHRYQRRREHGRRNRLAPPLLPRYPLHSDQHRLPGGNSTERRGGGGRCEPAGRQHDGLLRPRTASGSNAPAPTRSRPPSSEWARRCFTRAYRWATRAGPT